VKSVILFFFGQVRWVIVPLLGIYEKVATLLTIHKYLCILIKETFMPRRYTSTELIEMIKDAGWTLNRINGSHHHFHHLTKKGIVTIPHPVKDMDPKTANSIKRQAGLK
jgi:predicted RNA binding protein YcfA (HicA-like mRNA interferase family)